VIGQIQVMVATIVDNNLLTMFKDALRVATLARGENPEMDCASKRTTVVAEKQEGYFDS
jgi:hypothetical protein